MDGILKNVFTLNEVTLNNTKGITGALYHTIPRFFDALTWHRVPRGHARCKNGLAFLRIPDDNFAISVKLESGQQHSERQGATHTAWRENASRDRASVTRIRRIDLHFGGALNDACDLDRGQDDVLSNWGRPGVDPHGQVAELVQPFPVLREKRQKWISVRAHS